MDNVVAALADFVDLKVSHTARHSPCVGKLAAAMGAGLGLAQRDLVSLRRGALVHDLGCVSVPNRICAKKAALNRPVWERVRLHAYHSERVLKVAGPLKEAGELAGMHHERLDGPAITEACGRPRSGSRHASWALPRPTSRCWRSGPGSRGWLPLRPPPRGGRPGKGDWTGVPRMPCWTQPGSGQPAGARPAAGRRGSRARRSL